MLVLTRKQNEKIKIGENITVTVLRMKGKGVRLGIQAPDNMNVLRGELVFDLEDDQDSTSETPAEQSLDSRFVKSLRDFHNTAPWPNGSHPNSERNAIPECQPCWSI